MRTRDASSASAAATRSSTASRSRCPSTPGHARADGGLPDRRRGRGELIPGEEIHPFRLGGDAALLIITVINYRMTDIGNYIEFSIAIACTHGRSRRRRCCPRC